MRMCKMSSEVQTESTLPRPEVETESTLPRLDLLKKLLRGSSPKKPTYILGRILTDFTAQSFSELSVRGGEEVFILFEINDWAFVTGFTDTTRRGYVPLDYCEVIKDFFEIPCLKQSAKAYKQPSASSECNRRENKNTQMNKLSSPTKHSSAPLNKATAHTGTTTASSHHQHNLSSITDLQNGLRVPIANSLPAEPSQVTPTQEVNNQATPPQEVNSQATPTHEGSNCRCCCNHIRSQCEREHEFSHVLRYLSQSDLMKSPDHLEDSESGLGDSESVQSAGDLMKTSKQSTDWNDISTQTSLSLEDLREGSTTTVGLMVDECPSRSLSDESSDDISEILIPPPLLYRTPTPMTSEEIPLSPTPMTSEEFPLSPTAPRSLHTSVSCDSAYGDSVSDRSLSNHLPSTSVLIYNTSRGGNPRSGEDNSNHYENIRKRQALSSSDEEVEVTVIPDKQTQRLRRTKLTLPILEPTKAPNRVELTRLSQRIKEKLMPARAELIKCRLGKDVANSVEVPSVGEVAQSESSPTVESPVQGNAEERKQRLVTFQSIQEQYLKLEEARLLHNALKHLNQAMTTTSDL